MTCKDCIHVEMCHIERCYQDHRFEHRDEIETYCEHFKNKADFVEVVRCKDCKNYNGHRFCVYFEDTVVDEDFCSYGKGERNDSARTDKSVIEVSGR